MDFNGKNVLVMGLGTLGGGVGTSAFFAKQGARVTVTDLKTEKELESSIKALNKYPVRFVLGKHEASDFETADLVIKNPSVPSNSPFLECARKKNIPIEMAESLFMKLSPSRKVIGVTGTRGKSTTSHMIYEILQKAGKKAVLGGNIAGVSTLGLLDRVDPDTYIVLELSSWMLESFGWHRISPHIAVVTNIYPDHLNRYSSMKSYVDDKKNIYRFQHKNDHLVLNRDNGFSKEFEKEAQSTVRWFSGDDWNGSKPLLSIPGKHNRENAAAASTVALLLDITPDVFIPVISSFKGLPYRLEEVAVVNGVTFINDSTSTTPAAGIAALNAFLDASIILIAGGNSKNIPLGPFVDLIKKRVKHGILFTGTASDEFAHLPKKMNTVKLDDIEGAATIAYSLAKPGDVVLFSPGCTHLPALNEFERGDLYNRAVNSLQKTSQHKQA